MNMYYPRLQDILCDPCIDTVLSDGWTIDVGPWYSGTCTLAELFACTACRRLAQPHCTIHTFRTMQSIGTRNRYNAVREAGHLKASQVLGVPVFLAEITRAVRRGGSTGEGRVVFDVPLEGISLPDFITIGVAAQLATEQWLAMDPYLDTPANQLDTHYDARGDTRILSDRIRQVNPNADVVDELRRGRDRARALLDKHWEETLHISNRLFRRTKLTFGTSQDTHHDAGRRSRSRSTVHSVG